jgi:tetratricopeptide (TPR) repeat protein
MVPETGVCADHNWPQRMTMTTTNVEILRQGWLDAASALAPGLDTLPEVLEHGLEAAVIDERLDEQSLLRVVTEVTSAAADSLPAEELYFLTRRLQRAVYEYLLSLDALPEPPPRRDSSNGHATADATLIGAEEVAALGRNGHVKTVAEPQVTKRTPAREPEREPKAEAVAQAQLDPSAAAAAADRVEAGLAELDAQLSPDEPSDIAAETAGESEVETAALDEPGTAAAYEPATRPAFTLFRRTGSSASKADKAASASSGSEAVEPDPAATNGPGHPEVAGEDAEPFVKPKSGFHLSDLADFAVVERSATADATDDHAAAEPAAAVDAFEAAQPEPVQEFTESEPEAEVIPAQPAQEAASGAAARGWRLRDDDADPAHDLTSETDSDDNRFQTDPEVVEARLEINDRLRRRRCDEAAALLQRLANDVGGRALAELALDAGDRCRALGKGNAALSCYLAASRADPVHETPLLRLADICIDDHDIDLAVSYLERVTRLRRLRNDDKGALKLYRKIVTIAPYRDDILAMLMRAQANGRFDE